MANVTDGTLRMTEMIRGILAFSRPGNQGVEMVPVDSKSIVEVAKDNLALSISKSCAVITQDELPTIRAQPEQITQVFQNVIGNALKYCKAKGRPVIHIGCRESDHAWTFTIADNGIGVKKKDYAAIFQPFHRVHTDRFVKGYGIGLATCRKIVERHKGRMWVDSAPGKGSTFSFTIAKS
jgi:light-regulated signal transduction histidine kinase (bacteriophytochrome)